MSNDPSPEERAEYIVKRLELFIRENREPFKGMNFNKWQQLAKVEIANSLKDSERLRQDKKEQVSRRMLFIIGSSIATIGFGVLRPLGALIICWPG